MFLTKLGIPKLWREDAEVIWPLLRLTAAPVVLWLAPSYSYGTERVPESGGGVVAVNHLSAIDPPLVGAHCPRTVYFMTKAELLAMPVIGDLLARRTDSLYFPVGLGSTIPSSSTSVKKVFA